MFVWKNAIMRSVKSLSSHTFVRRKEMGAVIRVWLIAITLILVLWSLVRSMLVFFAHVAVRVSSQLVVKAKLLSVTTGV